jgi:hypothetical protein
MATWIYITESPYLSVRVKWFAGLLEHHPRAANGYVSDHLPCKVSEFSPQIADSMRPSTREVRLSKNADYAGRSADAPVREYYY